MLKTHTDLIIVFLYLFNVHSFLTIFGLTYKETFLKKYEKFLRIFFIFSLAGLPFCSLFFFKIKMSISVSINHLFLFFNFLLFLYSVFLYYHLTKKVVNYSCVNYRKTQVNLESDYDVVLYNILLNFFSCFFMIIILII